MIRRTPLVAGTLALLLCVLLISTAGADKPPRFAAMLQNGERVDGKELRSWQDNGAQPQLDGRQLMDGNNPLRWLRDRSQLPGSLPKAFIETHLGDRLPGVVIGYENGLASLYNVAQPHFRVRPEAALEPTSKGADEIVRVVAEFVRRIVWQKRETEDYEPSTLFFRDGRAVSFRAARFGDGYVNLLLDDGNRRVSFGEIAELHLPAVDPWEAYYAELAVLGPQPSTARLYQVETTEGLVVTGSYDRRRFRPGGKQEDFERWIHGVQPAWSLDPLYIVCGPVWCRRMWAAHEVPLSRIRPSSQQATSPLANSGRTPQVNRNVEGGPLRTQQQDFGWGFGVHANTELTFPLPAIAKSLRGKAALDRAAGQGGCVRARVFLGTTRSPPRWESPYLVGSAMEADLGTISLSEVPPNARQLILQVDAAHQGRPAGADPLDVRDMADWLDPVIELDPAGLQAEVAKRGVRQFAAWRDWQVSLQPDDVVQWNDYWNELDGAVGDFRLGVASRKSPIALRRELNLGTSDNWLVVFVNRAGSSGAPPRLEVRIAGEPVAEYEVPFRQRGSEDHPPLALSLVNYKGANKPIDIEIRQLPSPENSYVDWRGIAVVEQLPHLYRAFEDQGVFTAIDGEQTGAARLFAEERYYGTHCVQVTPAGQFQLKFEQPVAIRERPAWGEFRHIRFAVRKVGDGRVSLEVNRAGQPERPARYDAGKGEPVGGSATRLWDSNLPNQWIVLTRDLYADFGAFDATGLTLQAPDGEYALVDHVYLARRQEDFNLIPNAPPPELTNQKARRELAQPILEQGFPATVMIETQDGRIGGGVVISREGEVLTAGHLIANPNQDCRVYLPDGRTVKAQTRGIYRDFDWGLIKITEPGEYRNVERGNANEIPENQLYVGFAHTRELVKDAKPAAHIVGIRRVFRGMVWTDFELENWSSGGPLLNREGKVIGILAKRSEFGGFLFSRLENFDGHLGRLRNGEVYGAWYPGLGPMFGINVMSTRDGAKVMEVFANSPAASANLMMGDIVTKVDGRSVVSLEDIYAVLSEKNAGQEASVEYFRGGQMLTTKLLLVPRAP
jgi:S1-C subfamily serine protease